MKKIHTPNMIGSINNPVDEIYPNDCLFRGTLNHTMRIKPHYKKVDGIWKRFWCKFVYTERFLS